MTPTSAQHRNAIEVLLLLMDSAFLIVEAWAAIEVTRRLSAVGEAAGPSNAVNSSRSAHEHAPVFDFSTRAKP